LPAPVQASAYVSLTLWVSLVVVSRLVAYI
jgi:hypothetical protein